MASSTDRWRTLRVIGIAALFASVPALFITLGVSARYHVPVWRAFVAEGLAWYTWALLTPVILSLARRFPVDAPPRGRAIGMHLICSVSAGIVLGVVAVILYEKANIPSLEMEAAYSRLLAICYWVPFGILFYGVIATVGFALDYHGKLRERDHAAARLESLLVESRLGALRMQLQPHFLFNSLNTVAMLVRQGDAQTSIRVLARLSELLRQVLDEEAAQEVPLSDELDFVERYLEIERVRFGERLHVRVVADEETRSVHVPHLLLQPLVENAVRHGISRRAEAGLVEVCAERVNGRLILDVRDNGPGLPAGFDSDGRPGIGLRNTRARLRYLYGDGATLELVNHAHGGAHVRIVMPVRHG